MREKTDRMKDKNSESEILFSRSVKAGKRIYYLDVKCDRKGDFYISITESKRLKEVGEGMNPTFEKHKVFLFSEDLDKFANAFADVAEYVRDKSPERSYSSDWSMNSDYYSPIDDARTEEAELRIEF